jgi:hypothetical protein
VKLYESKWVEVIYDVISKHLNERNEVIIKLKKIES